MKHLEMIKRLAEDSGIKESKAKEVINAFVNIITEELVAGNQVRVNGLGTFETGIRAAREMKNPQNPEETISVGEKVTAKLKISNSIKNELNK